MDTGMLIFILYVITVAGFAATGAFLYLRFKKLEEGKGSDAALTMLNQNLQGMQTGINERLDNAARAFGELAEIGRSMRAVQDLLRSPKLRGNLGEQLLQELLEQVLPKKAYSLQYTFNSGSTVDAIVRTKNGLIPIDAKFPAENYQKAMATQDIDEQDQALHEFRKDVRKHITDISKKYILPAEGTVDFALMYLPTPSIYTYVSENEELYDFACERKIFFVSPNTFYYFMQILLIAFSGEEVEKRAKAVLRDIQAIRQESGNFAKELSTLNTHVGNAKNAMEKVNSGFRNLKGHIDATGRLQETSVEQIEELTDQAVEFVEMPEEEILSR